MNKRRKKAAEYAASLLKRKFNLENSKNPPIGIILGTGWGEVLSIESAEEMPFTDIPDFKNLPFLEGHKRMIVCGKIAGKQVLVLQGRLHLNEIPFSKRLLKLVRLQTEMLLAAGVKQLVVTSAVGSLKPFSASEIPTSDRPLIPGNANLGKRQLQVGDIAVVDGFVSLYAPVMPLWGGEFYSPDDVINEKLINIALAEASQTELVAQKTGMAMVRGPQFEGRKYDKKLLSQSGAGVVGMSMYPEACVAAIYGTEFLGLGFVTNDDEETHSHPENLERAKKASKNLGEYLQKIIAKI